jgi:hypothetical protein
VLQQALKSANFLSEKVVHDNISKHGRTQLDIHVPCKSAAQASLSRQNLIPGCQINGDKNFM